MNSINRGLRGGKLWQSFEVNWLTNPPALRKNVQFNSQSSVSVRWLSWVQGLSSLVVHSVLFVVIGVVTPNWNLESVSSLVVTVTDIWVLFRTANINYCSFIRPSTPSCLKCRREAFEHDTRSRKEGSRTGSASGETIFRMCANAKPLPKPRANPIGMDGEMREDERDFVLSQRREEGRGGRGSLDEILMVIDNSTNSKAPPMRSNCSEMQLLKLQDYEANLNSRRFAVIPADSEPIWIKRDM